MWPGDPVASIERAFGLPGGALTRAAFAPTLLRRATTGAISDQQWREKITDNLAAEYGDRAAAAVAAWSELPGVLDAEMVDLLQRVRENVPVVLLTNATTRLQSDLSAAGLTDSFDAVANSSALGVAKPDRDAFEGAARLVGVPLHACVVIDDQPGHLDAARAAGAAAIHHQSAERTRDALIALGVPLAP